MSSCKKCGEEYTDVLNGWCKPYQTDNLKGNFASWISGNEKIDDFIQEMQLKISNSQDIIFEWIPYNQFSDIKEIGRNGFATVYSAICKDGPLEYNRDIGEYVKLSMNYKVTLKCSQHITNEILNEV